MGAIEIFSRSRRFITIEARSKYNLVLQDDNLSTTNGKNVVDNEISATVSVSPSTLE